ncbi:MAG TPA: carbohydrate kinase family protein [Actinomycetota bacterium]|nr:carbohydrate kinase family protein [Actinomycetota bacterium]
MTDLDLLVLGDANPDLILTGDVEPVFGQAEKLVRDAALVVGGSGAIAACAAARLGLRVGFVGVLGDDVFGRFMLEALTERGVDVSRCVTDPDRPTGLSVVLSRPEDRAILTSVGTIADLRAEMIGDDLLGATRHVHVSSYFLQDALRPALPALFERAHAAGAATSVDPNWDPAERWDGGLLPVLAQTDIFLPNSVEARAITHIDDADAAARTLAERGAIVAVKSGQGGGLAVAGDEVVRAGSIPTEVVDTTGAGDAFDAGFLAGRLSGWPLRRCLELAVACGSLSTRALGGTGAQPTMEEAVAAMETVS